MATTTRTSDFNGHQRWTKKFFPDRKAGASASGDGRPHCALARRAFLAILAVLGIFLGSVLTARSASAATPDCANTHCYSVGQYTIGPHLGAHASIPLTNMKSGPADYVNANHIDSEMWVALDVSGNHYIEAGILDGFQRPDNGHVCDQSICVYDSFEPGSGGNSTCVSAGCGAYEIFWAILPSQAARNINTVTLSVSCRPIPASESTSTSTTPVAQNGPSALRGAYTHTDTSTIESAYHQTKYVVWGAEYQGPKNNGECGSPAAIGAEMLGTNETLIPVEMATKRIDQPFTGKGYLSEWDWSLPGSC